jgi:hypothetical protein
MAMSVGALLTAVLAALALAACGGGGSSTMSEASSTSASQPASGKSGSAKGEGQPTKEANAGNSRQPKSASGRAEPVPPLKVSGGGSGQFKTKGGDNSIQEFGGEGDESELRQAAETLHGFYVAQAGEEWAKACSHLAESTTKQFEALASRSPQLKGKGCATVLHAFTRPLPPSVERETTLVDAVSLRREGERAFLIYRGAEGKGYAIPVRQEGGAWKVAGLAGTPLG